MKFFTKKSAIQKIVFVIIILLLGNFTLAPYYSYADDDGGWSLAGSLAKELMQLLSWFGDMVMGALNHFMLGADGYGSAMLGIDDWNFKSEAAGKSWLYVDADSVKENDDRTIIFEKGTIDTSSFLPGTKFEIPNMLYSPENIFANNIAALDINFLKENKYTSIYAGGSKDFKEDAEKAAESAVSRGDKDSTLKNVIASWYKSFRNIAIVGLLSVLIYLGIRILISSTAADKAKYKETMQDWVVALCLVFVIHFIMSAVLMVTDKCAELFSSSINEGYTVKVEGTKNSQNKEVAFKTNLMGLIRFNAQSKDAITVATYTVLYLALVIYTCIFTIMYLKRFLYMAFFTMIAPLVALTYPIDKAGDGKAQAFNLWFKEYTMNAIIQPIHLILYTVFVGSAYKLAIDNPIYALVAMGFLIPAEKFIKKMFGLDRAESASGFGSFAGGALAMSGLKKLSGMGPGEKGGKGQGKGEVGGDTPDKGIFMPPSSTGKLPSFGGNSSEQSSPTEQNKGEDDASEKALNKYKSEGYKQNANGEYFNPYTDEYDPEYDPTKDSSYLQGDAGVSTQTSSDVNVPSIDTESDTASDAANDTASTRSDVASNDRINFVADRESGDRTSNEEKPKPIKGYEGRLAKRGAKAAGKQIWKHGGKVARAGMRVAGAAAGATVGLAAGITTGDFSKTAQYMSAGALAGNAIGANTQRAAVGLGAGTVKGVKQIGKTTDDFKRARDEEKYGLEYAREQQRQRQNEKATKEFLKNDEEKRKYRDLAAKMGYEGNDITPIMKAAADYKVAGITDDTLIFNSLQAEYERDGSFGGRNHKQFVEVASFAHDNKFGGDHITDAKKREQLDTTIDGVIGGNNDNAKREAALMFAEVVGGKSGHDTYEKNGRYGKANMGKNKK